MHVCVCVCVIVPIKKSSLTAAQAKAHKIKDDRARELLAHHISLSVESFDLYSSEPQPKYDLFLREIGANKIKNAQTQYNEDWIAKSTQV